MGVMFCRLKAPTRSGTQISTSTFRCSLKTPNPYYMRCLSLEQVCLSGGPETTELLHVGILLTEAIRARIRSPYRKGPIQAAFQDRWLIIPLRWHLIFRGDFEANALKSLMLRPDDCVHHTRVRAHSELNFCG